jgi:hypothetical protein
VADEGEGKRWVEQRVACFEKARTCPNSNLTLPSTGTKML